MKVLLSAYSCLPGRGSEPGAGWAWASAAAGEHDVWLLTHTANSAIIEPMRTADGQLRHRLHPVYLHLGGAAERMRRGGPLRFVYYVLWQLGPCRRAAVRLHKSVELDIAHHVTYAADWAPVGVAGIQGLPFVWGPVGGSSTLGAPGLWRHLGVRGAVDEAFRAVVLETLRVTVGRWHARRAAVVLGQNHDVARAFAPIPVTVEPHVALEPRRIPAREPSDAPVAIYAGRLLAWKGIRIALAALLRPEAATWRLDIYGDGPQRTSLTRLAQRWGVSERVRFHGNCPRAEIVAALAEADVLLFPSLHDAAGWAVAEAVAAGCPVVALDRAGPAALLCSSDGILVEPRGDVIGALAAALDQARQLRPGPSRWGAERLPGVLRAAYATAVGHARTVEAAA
jgi:glycosyltransferase involved in cell wall biosynthesis